MSTGAESTNKCDATAVPLRLSDTEMTWPRAVPISSLSADHVSSCLVQPPHTVSFWVHAFGDCPLLSENKILIHPTNERFNSPTCLQIPHANRTDPYCQLI